MTDLRVVARYKDSDLTNPKFTKSTTPEELMAELFKCIPVDMVYYVVPHQDGRGYSLREAGLVTLDLHHGVVQPPVTLPPPPSSDADYSPVLAPGRDLAPEPIPTPTPDPIIAPQPHIEAQAAKSKDKPKRRSKATPKDDQDPDPALPVTTSGGGTIDITALHDATPETIAASSHVNRRW